MNRIKKHRGLRRYYKRLGTQNEPDKSIWPNFHHSETWSKYGHMQFDRYGYGNNSFKRRRSHLDKLFRHFDLLAEKMKDSTSDYQPYSILLDFDSSSDALYLHTSVSNNIQFPFKTSDLDFKTTLSNKQLDDYISNLKGYEKLFGQAGQAFCLIYKKNLGKAF